MLTATVFSVILAAAAAYLFPPVDLPSQCAAILCPVGTICIEEPTKNGVQARCVAAGPKPGECPSPDPFSFGQCEDGCSQDMDCDGDQKCCKNFCGALTCQQPRPSCATLTCKPGQKCEMQDLVCVRSPCDPQPVCVDVGKDWECPVPEPNKKGICAFTCSSDSECDGDKKCCKNSCGSTNCRSPPSQILTTPAPTRPTCKTVKCQSGKRCELQQVVCVRAPCYPQPVCVDIVKPGECPKFVPYFYFGRLCLSDFHCPGDQKCCKAGFVGHCQDPARTCATVDCEPDYTCVMKCDGKGCSPKPVCEPVKRCPFYPAWINPNCVRQDLCSEDGPDKCRFGLLCCSTDCGRRCVEPM